MDTSKKGRNTSRFAAGLPAAVRIRGGEHPCEATNLSRSGALLIGALAAEVGQRIGVDLRSTGGDVSVTLEATVVRFEPAQAEAASRLAVAFEEPDAARRDALEALIARVVEGGGPAVLDGLPPTARPEQIRAALEQVPLPHRIALAARARPQERAQLLHDPSPQVIESLVRNPQILPPEVRTLLRLPTLLPSTLEILGRDTRWRGFEELRVLIAAHPNTPPALAERIADALTRDGAQKLLRHGSLSTALRRRLLQKHALR